MPRGEERSDLFGEVDFHQMALSIWREREQQFPVFVRRPVPDAMDRATGALEAVYAEAKRRFWGQS